MMALHRGLCLLVTCRMRQVWLYAHTQQSTCSPSCSHTHSRVQLGMPDALQVASSAKGKEQLIAQMQGIVESLTENNKKLQERLGREKEARDKMKEQELSLIEKEREYYKAVKDYETECGKNEILISKVERRNRKQG